METLGHDENKGEDKSHVCGRGVGVEGEGME